MSKIKGIDFNAEIRSRKELKPKPPTSQSIAEELKNLIYATTITEGRDRDGNETWDMHPELVGKVIDEYLSGKIDELVEQERKKQRIICADKYFESPSGSRLQIAKSIANASEPK